MTTTRGMIVTLLYRPENEPAVSGAIAFEDVAAGEYYYDAVSWAGANSIVNGYDEDTFGPNNAITREQMATILYRYCQYKGYDVTATGDLSQFTDSNETADWAKTALVWAVEHGLMEGNGDGTINPAGTATRAEVAQMLMNFCEEFVK